MPKNQNALTSTTQEFLDIYDIANDLVMLKSGSVSLVLTVTAMNFGLLAEEEQDAIIYGYAGLLNSLNYPIQIVIRSQTKDITSYLNVLIQKENETINPLRKEQIRRYREFVADLVQERNVLDKKFYVIIPASGIELGIVSAQSVVPGIKNPDISSFDRSVIIERARNLLEPKRDHLMAQFGRIGLFARQLKTQELIQLFYTIYNTESSDGQRMTDSRNYTTTLVEGSWENQRAVPDRDQQPESMTRPTMNAETFTPVVSPETPFGPAVTQSAPPIEPAMEFSPDPQQLSSEPTLEQDPGLLPQTDTDLTPPVTGELPPPMELT